MVVLGMEIDCKKDFSMAKIKLALGKIGMTHVVDGKKLGFLCLILFGNRVQVKLSKNVKM